ncbi:histidinol dehydrogenase [Desulfohalovibrio reitneri]|uniref:histidinol dehydrogenase n=1 Tax=Desulfohalovibrio reitneri TaxID=1307759 RepID=UPI0004A73252|nr:histidinol dehydrogenase [Desulfohalovibrio reitneri]
MPCRQFTVRTLDDITDFTAWLAGRSASADQSIETKVRDILSEVRQKGDAALVDYCRRFDCPGFDPDHIRVDPVRMAEAAQQVPAGDMEIIARAAENIRAFHQRQTQNSWWSLEDDGSIMGQIVRPVDRAGLYVPGGAGGDTPLVSSLLMNAVPAQVAGVEGIAVTTPPLRDGGVNPYILATAHLLGIEEVYALGSAWAVAALAYGTETIPRVDVVTGPGNIFVTTAKRLLIGTIGIDMLAGPSEIAILADDSADPAHLAADMLSQAEHDPLAASVAVTDSPELAEQLMPELLRQRDALPRADIARQALDDWGAVVLVDDLEQGCRVVNAMAPEHLEIAVRDPFAWLGLIRHAGAIFLGHDTPEPVGDYFAGPNHILPTMGTPRFDQALSVETFLKKSSLIRTPREYLERFGEDIARLARLEGLEAHARAVEIRSKDGKQ